MAETLSVYAGKGRVGVLKKRALERESRRMGRKMSISDLFWNFVKTYGSERLRRDLELAEKAEG